ncbi:TonB-dependent receptor plug domain-containing protein, partial [Halieaceae bacterium]|nr:TonB-dependent receptor plug domain-containing protein [Halieaceae bacterium]
MSKRSLVAWSILMASLIGVTAQSAIAVPMEVVHIIGTSEDANQIAGSSDVITAEELEKFEYTDIHRILASVPGVYLRDEDGYGLRPNISIRGTFSDRSGKITLMEDGVLIAPAPYTASSAYYFPTTGRINGIEVLKGAAAIENGPYTVGGAVNLISTPIPSQWGGFVQQELSSDNGYRLHAAYGGSEERYGLFIEAHTQATDGFSDIDNSNRDSGFNKDDLLLKARYNSADDADTYQQLDLKLQYSEESSDQTYVGLTEA